MPLHDVAFITSPPPTVTGWVSLFDPAALPVLAESAGELEELRSCSEAVDARLLADMISNDPLMTIKVLAHVAQLRRGHSGSDAETVLASLVMLGIEPFFRAFGTQPTIELLLVDHPEALEGLQAVLLRSRRAARFALGFAAHRMDHDAAVLYEAALMHDFAEMLLWLRAPELASEIVHRQRNDAELRSASAQRAVLGIELDELEHALMLAWGLPRLLVAVTDERAGGVTPQMQNVRLAVRVARHSARDWLNPALPDDISDVAALLNLSPDAASRLLQEIDCSD